MTSFRPHRTQMKSMELMLLPAFINVVRRVIVECTHGADEPCGVMQQRHDEEGSLFWFPCARTPTPDTGLRLAGLGSIDIHCLALTNPSLTWSWSTSSVPPSALSSLVRRATQTPRPPCVTVKTIAGAALALSESPLRFCMLRVVCCSACHCSLCFPASTRRAPAGVAWCPNMEMPDSPPQKVLPCGLFSKARASAKCIQGLGGCRCAFLSPKYRDIAMRRSGGRARKA
ncbi:hypothetical protein B0H14DRAFT_638452 [Mycena olivaceomarginata]|nr:hypothetical protein B0H14DRAFT_638452 [Mycena olivaceomarginata]